MSVNTDLLDEAEAALRAMVAHIEARARTWQPQPMPATQLVDSSGRPLLLDIYLGLIRIEQVRSQA